MKFPFIIYVHMESLLGKIDTYDSKPEKIINNSNK